MKLPEIPFSNIETYRGKADKYSTVLVDRSRYSVPARCVGLQLDIVATVERVEIFYRREKIAHHERVYGSNKWQLNPFHYLELILNGCIDLQSEVFEAFCHGVKFRDVPLSSKGKPSRL